MLECKARQGAGRILEWTHGEAKLRLPWLMVPETRMFGDLGHDFILSSQPRDDVMNMVSQGTWFYPEAEGSDDVLMIPAIAPTPTDQVQVMSVGDVAIFHDAGGWAKDPKKLLPAFVEAKTQATPAKAFYAPALGTPADYAVWTYLGVDIFDATPLLVAATRGTALTVDGPMPAAQAANVFGIETDASSLAAFNVAQAVQELRRIHAAIEEGTLRPLAERRAYTHPDTVGLLRRFDQHHTYLESVTPVGDDKPVPCMTWESLWMPEVERFRRRLRDQYVPPESADVLVLLPCSARKPYRISQSHRYFQRALDDTGIRHRVHEVMITSPMGVVPRDLEDIHPANRYDVPVTGDWNQDEKEVIRKQLKALMAKADYQHVVAHVPQSTYDFIADLLPEGHQHTVSIRPSSIEDCTTLRDTLRTIRDTDKKPTGGPIWKARKTQDMRGAATYQFGPEAGTALTSGYARGRLPGIKLFDNDGEQLGQNTMDRGLLSLTLPGAKIVADQGVKRVFQGDFQIQKTGSLFATGVEHADADIRPGDDVVVMRGDEVTACGVARMSAGEMTYTKRGVAVTLRHVVKAEKKPIAKEVTA